MGREWRACRQCVFPGIHLGHSANASTPQPSVRVTVPPTVDGALNEATLFAQWRIQLSQCPTHSITFRFIRETVAAIMLSVHACSWVYAIRVFEFLAERIRVDRLNIASYGVLHLHSVARVLECDPLYPVTILADDERRGCRNWSRCCIRIDTAWRHVAACAHRATILLMLWWCAQWSGRRPTQLWHVLHLCPGTIAHWLWLMRLVLHVLTVLMRQQQRVRL